MPWEGLDVGASSITQDNGDESLSATQRLTELSQLLVPLMDRYGRVLTDAAPHLDIEYSTETTTTDVERIEETTTQASVNDLVREMSTNPSDRFATPTGTRLVNQGDSRRTPSPTISGIAPMLAANLPPSLRSLLQPR